MIKNRYRHPESGDEVVTTTAEAWQILTRGFVLVERDVANSKAPAKPKPKPKAKK